MPVDAHISAQNWYRYAWVRDQGHIQYCEKHDKCERFFAGHQWDETDKAALLAIRRPALTINRIIATIGNVMGEQIYQRAETGFLPGDGADPQTAVILGKLFKADARKNQLEWKRSDMFADGVIGSRGYLDMRIEFDENMRGNIVFSKMNPKNVLVDPDGDDMDPDTWNEVITSKWVTPDDIAILYSKKDADLLRGTNQSAFPYGYDSVDAFRDRFGGRSVFANAMYGFQAYEDVNRNIRVIERQHKKLDTVLHFVNPQTGEFRVIPETWDEERVRFVAQKYQLGVIKKLVKRIRWTVTADNVCLHDDWSPYKHFTIVPYFPYFRHGNTIGLIENLIDPQELLNKAESQNLHIINTSANSGWIVKSGALTNMSMEELEERGAETGLVLEVSEDVEKAVKKIQPNSVPTGHDRLAFKAEDHIDKISGVNTSMQGQDREDVSAKAMVEKKQSGKTNLVKPLDSLTRTDYFIGRNYIDLVQEFYTEPRVVNMVKDSNTGEIETFEINKINEETGEVLNDLTVGQFQVAITSIPARETMEDTVFEQLVAMKTEMNIQSITDEDIIGASRLPNKQEILDRIRSQKNSPQAQQQAQLEARAQQAAVQTAEGEAQVKQADAGLRQAKAVQIQHETANPDGGTPGLDVHVAQHEQTREDGIATRDADRKDAESQAKIQAVHHDQQRKDVEGQQKLELQRQAQEQAAADARVKRLTGPESSE